MSSGTRWKYRALPVTRIKSRDSAVGFGVADRNEELINPGCHRSEVGAIRHRWALPEAARVDVTALEPSPKLDAARIILGIVTGALVSQQGEIAGSAGRPDVTAGSSVTG